MADDRINGDEVRDELAESILVDYLTTLGAQRNSDLVRRIRATLRDGNIDTDFQPSYTHEGIIKLIMRAILEG